MKNALRKHRYRIAYAAILALAVFLHFYDLSSVPAGLHIDEAGTAYDAFAIANYGVSRYLQPYPVVFTNFGGAQSALYAYLCALSIKLLGLGTFAIRLPAALGFFVTLGFGTLIVRKGLGKAAALVAAALYTVWPYFIMQSRYGLDCNLMLPVCTAALYVFLTALEKQCYGRFALAGGLFGLALYSYSLSYLILPVFLLLSLTYLLYTKRIRFTQMLVMGGVLLVVGWPLIAFVFINQFGLPALETAWFTIPRLPWFRGDELVLSNIFANVQTVFQCIFFKDTIPSDALDIYYTMYLCSIPFATWGFGRCVLGLWQSIKAKTYQVSDMVLLFLASVLLVGLLISGSGPQVHKLNAMYGCWVYMAVVGLCAAYERFCHGRWFAAAMAGLYALSLLGFLRFYFVVYPGAYPIPQEIFYPSMAPVCEKLFAIDDEVDTVYIAPHGTYLYFMLATEASPYDMLYLEDGTSIYEGKYHFSQPPEIDPVCIYVVHEDETQPAYLQQLEDAGLVKVYDDAFVIYAPPGLA